jgi:hypothetical protein
VSGLQFANSFEGSPIPLQAAAVAAEAAEVMRQGYNFAVSSPTSYAYFPKPFSLQHVQSAASRVNPQLTERGSFQRLMRLVEQVDSVGIQRLPTAARSGERSVASGRWRESGG